MANQLGDFNSSEVIFVDANIFLHNAFATPNKGESVRLFLEKIELTQVQALTSALVLNEVLFKLSLQIAAGLLHRPTPWSLRQAMRDEKTLSTQIYDPVRQYFEYIQALTTRGLSLVNVTAEQTGQAILLGQRYGLSITDATHLAVCEAYQVQHIATDDQDLWLIPAMTAWTP
jgi:predicted nucleic acid-binding protein